MEIEKKAGGAFIGLIIIIIILVLGGIYMWKVNKDTVEDIDTTAQTEAVTETDINELDTLEQEADVLDANTGVDADSIN